MTRDSADSNYFDWNSSFEIIKKAYDSSLFVLIIGPKVQEKLAWLENLPRIWESDCIQLTLA